MKKFVLLVLCGLLPTTSCASGSFSPHEAAPEAPPTAVHENHQASPDTSLMVRKSSSAHAAAPHDSSKKKDDEHDADHNKAHWSYDGKTGPEYWGKMKMEWAHCGYGKKQSPVNLGWSPPEPGAPIELYYRSSPLKVIDNGHTIQVNFPEGSYANIRSKRFELLQLHFHSNSEHTLSGRPFPMEAHLVHKSKQGKLAVVGVMLVEGRHNDTIEQIWQNIPDEKGKEELIDAERINPINLIPDGFHYYHYMGSLTTPPCSEGVNWNVVNTPTEISREQLEKFRSLYPHNNRPIQPMNGRVSSLY